MEIKRYVAIDNVCAWPNFTKLPDGTILTTIFNQPTHGGWEGDVECWVSNKQGTIWQLRGVPAFHEPGTNRMNVAAGMGWDGSLLVLASGWSKRNSPGNPTSPHDGEVLPMWVCASSDNGATWALGGSVQPDTVSPHLIPFGDIIQLPDRMLGVCLYGWTAQQDNKAVFYISDDMGKSWLQRSTISAHDANESAPVLLPDGQLLVAVRTRSDAHVELFKSTDLGLTWDNGGSVTLGNQHPGHLLVLHDGRILLTYGIRNSGLYGIGARFSRDHGQTWDPPIVLVNLEGATDGGYPSSVESEDGSIVTAYYANKVICHQRYHMGVLRWFPGD